MKNSFSVILVILITCGNTLTGQSVSQLEKEKMTIEKSISQSNSLLKKYANQKQKSLVSINLLSDQIKSRERLIGIYNDEIAWLQEDIGTLKTDIGKSERDLDLLKLQYEKLVQKAFRNRIQYNELSFFFGASSFNEAYRRFIILKEYNKFRKSQGVLIQKGMEDLKEKYKLLDTKLEIQTAARNKLRSETNNLLVNKTNLSRSVSRLKQKESTLKKQIRANKKALKKLENEIVRLIAETAKNPVEFSEFDQAKGHLPLPLKDGIIIKRFGQHQHPVLKYVKVHNNGIDIQATSSNNALCVFEGIVSRVVSIPGYNRAVLIRHGHFLTVYANLSKVAVQSGAKIKKGDLVGKIYEGEGENSGVLHFELWQESKKINPELWLSK